MGRPAYKPTEKDRAQVKMLSGMGVTSEDIAAVVGISEPTMRKYFSAELKVGFIQANAQVAQSLYKQATDKDKPNVIAAIFWLKTRAGWKEAKDVELGKKEIKQQSAGEVTKGRFSPSAPPKLIAANGKKV
jgi:hypothetical protein